MVTTRTVSHKYAPDTSWTNICHPDDPHKTLVSEQGALLYDYVNSVPGEGIYWFNKVFSFGLRTPRPIVTITQTTESARHPFVKTVIEYVHAVLTLTAFAHEHDGQRTDIVLWSVAAAEGRVAVDTAVWVDGQALGKVFVLPEHEAGADDIYNLNTSQTVYMVDAHKWRHIPSYFMVEANHLKYAEPDETIPEFAYQSVPHPLQIAPGQHFGPVARMRTAIFTVTAGQPVQGAFIFPLTHSPDEVYTLDWAQNALEIERRFWDDSLLRPLDWQIPDDGIMDMLTACARNILQAREIKDGLPEFQVGATSYRGLWVVDGHFILEGARYLGHESAGEQGINALLKRVQPSGAIMQLDFHPKETAISIMTLIRQCELNDDWERLASIWPVIQNGVSYIRQMREDSKQRGPEAPEYNLMPATFADGGLGGNRPEYTTALWTLAGLKKAVEAARKLGYTEDLERFTHEYEDLLSVFRKKTARDMRTLPDGTPYLPICMPDVSGEHIHIPDYDGEVSPYYRINPGTATWALAHAIYPGEVFTPDDPLVQNLCTLLDLYDDEEGVPAYTGWIPHNALWNYAGSFYAHVWLYAGRPDKAIDYLYDFANHATPTRVWREEQSLRSASYEQIVGDMPHNWASGEFIRLVRDLLVFERGNTLDLLMGLPPEWIKPDAFVYLEKTPTRFGAVTLHLAFDADCSGTLELSFDTGRSQQADAVMLYIPKEFTSLQMGDGVPEQVTTQSIQLPFVEHQIIHLWR